MARIAVIAGVETERAVLARLPDVSVALSGARREGAERAIARLLADEPVGLLSFGSAGGLDPDLPSGSLMVAADVLGRDGETYATDAAWRAELSGALGVQPVNIVGSDLAVHGLGKRRLWEATGAACVDMESHIAARMARAAGVPFAVLRAVLDPCDRDVPRWIDGTIGPDGSVSVGKVLAGLAGHPGDIGKLLALRGDHAKAMTALRGAVGTLGAGLGLTR